MLRQVFFPLGHVTVLANAQRPGQRACGSNKKVRGLMGLVTPAD